MVYECELEEHDLVAGVNYKGLLTCSSREATIRIDRINYVFDGNIENLGRRARFGNIESHDDSRAVVVLEDDLGPCTFTFRRK